MNRNSISFGLALMMAAAMFSGCASDDMDELVQNREEKAIRLFSSVHGTRGEGDLQATSLASSTKVGVFGVATSVGATISNNDNVPYSVSGSALTADGGQTMMCKGSATIYAYAPYQENWALDADNTFSVATDQSTDEGYLASDLLWASDDTDSESGTASLEFSHLLSRVRITITNSTGADLTNVSVIIKAKISTTLNPSTGSVGEASGDVVEITLAKELSIPNGDDKAVSVYGVIIPQTIDANAELLYVKYGNKTTIVKRDTQTEFSKKTSTNITLTIR